MSNMTAAQDRARLLRMVAVEMKQGRYVDAHMLMADAERMGRSHRWLLAAAGLRIALYDATCGDDPIFAEAALHEAKRAAK
jgi:hypothetical protein